MTEIIRVESRINAPSGECLVRLFYDDLTGLPTRAVMYNITPAVYHFYIGLADRTIGYTEIIPGSQVDRPLSLAVNIGDGSLVNWLCATEGGA